MRPVIITSSDRVTPHLTWGELGCHDAIGTPYPLNWRASRGVLLAAVFESIRQACGNKPIAVDSAYRTPEYNAKVGGAPHSQHVQGRALDLQPPEGLTVERFHSIIVALAHEELGDIGGIGLYRTFVHVDIRPRPADGHVAEWQG